MFHVHNIKGFSYVGRVLKRLVAYVWPWHTAPAAMHGFGRVPHGLKTLIVTQGDVLVSGNAKNRVNLA